MDKKEPVMNSLNVSAINTIHEVDEEHDEDGLEVIKEINESPSKTKLKAEPVFVPPFGLDKI
jgi:hypothetical protein